MLSIFLFVSFFSVLSFSHYPIIFLCLPLSSSLFLHLFPFPFSSHCLFLSIYLSVSLSLFLYPFLCFCLSMNPFLLFSSSLNTIRCCYNLYQVKSIIARGAVGRRIDPSWGGPIQLFLVPASASRLV